MTRPKSIWSERYDLIGFALMFAVAAAALALVTAWGGGID